MGVVAYVITQNVTGSRTPDPRTHADGYEYRHAMFFNNYSVLVYADTPAELLESLILNYLALDSDERREARINCAREIATAARKVIRDEWDDSEGTTPSVVVDADMGEETSHDLAENGDEKRAEGQPPLSWRVAAAEGDLEFLTSLHEMSVISLWVNQNAIVPEGEEVSPTKVGKMLPGMSGGKVSAAK